MLLDAGGGTVDAITYTVTNTEPLRLQSEVVESDGKLCGSSFLNEDLRAFAKERLKDEIYLWQAEEGQSSLDDVVEKRIIKKFENQVKRNMDFRVGQSCNVWFEIPNLRANETKRFRHWNFPVTQ